MRPNEPMPKIMTTYVERYGWGGGGGGFRQFEPISGKIMGIESKSVLIGIVFTTEGSTVYMHLISDYLKTTDHLVGQIIITSEV